MPAVYKQIDGRVKTRQRQLLFWILYRSTVLPVVLCAHVCVRKICVIVRAVEDQSK